jgi:hypothetical protein
LIKVINNTLKVVSLLSEKAKHANSDFTEPVQFLFAYPHPGIMDANISTLPQ